MQSKLALIAENFNCRCDRECDGIDSKPKIETEWDSNWKGIEPITEKLLLAIFQKNYGKIIASKWMH